MADAARDPLEYGPDSIQTIKGLDVVRKRPGMYLGGLGRLGTANLFGAAVDVLVAICVNRSSSPCFRHHAFLTVELHGRDATVAVDHHPSEATDMGERIADMIANRDMLRPGRWDLSCGEPNSAAPLAVLRALSETFHLARYAEGTTETVIVENDGPAPNFSQPEKGRCSPFDSPSVRL